jgi:hypothetical protein
MITPTSFAASLNIKNKRINKSLDIIHHHSLGTHYFISLNYSILQTIKPNAMKKLTVLDLIQLHQTNRLT